MKNNFHRKGGKGSTGPEVRDTNNVRAESEAGFGGLGAHLVVRVYCM